MQTGDHGGPIFTYPFSAHSLSTGGPSDLWCVTAPSNSRLTVREVVIGQYSEAGDAQAEMLSISFLTGSTSTGGGTAISGINVKRYSGAASAGSSVTGPSTTLSSTASAALVRSDSFNVAAGYRYYPVPDERIEIGLSQRLAIRLSTPNDGITINGTLVLQQTGQTPQ